MPVPGRASVVVTQNYAARRVDATTRAALG